MQFIHFQLSPFQDNSTERNCPLQTRKTTTKTTFGRTKRLFQQTHENGFSSPPTSGCSTSGNIEMRLAVEPEVLQKHETKVTSVNVRVVVELAAKDF
jgi:hypothetical protein